jgi:hypothetical protein
MRIVFLFILFFALSSSAAVEHTLLKKLAVFPIADANFSNAEDAWWQMRELLTKDQRFFVASRRFMMNRGVFQPRKNLKPADVIILSRILDAQAIVVTFLEDRVLKMRVFDGESGYKLWEGDAEFHPALSINDQLSRISSQLIASFINAIPYQGHQVVDEVIGKPVFEQGDEKLAKVQVGNHMKLETGDQVQWIKILGEPGSALFSEGARITVVAEGKIKKIEGDQLTVQIDRLADFSDLKENALVRFPREMNRLKEMYATPEKSANLSNEYLSSEMQNTADLSKGHNPTVSALAWILNIAGFVLLAF